LRRVHALATTVALLLGMPTTAWAAQSVELTAAFTPDRLNTPTTISFGIHISAEGGIPSPLTGINLRYPFDVGVASSELGLATCLPSRLKTYGPQGCPANSIMGHGIALAEIPLEAEPISETAVITLLAGPPQDGHLDIIVYAEGHAPVNAEIIFAAMLLPESTPFGGRLHFNVPLVPSIPEAPDVSIVNLQTTLGPLGLIYTEHVHGRTISYHPRGILIPPTCPRGGFPFTADLTFQHSPPAHAKTTVPCPTTHIADRRG
jgi:hypothetical protein